MFSVVSLHSMMSQETQRRKENLHIENKIYCFMFFFALWIIILNYYSVTYYLCAEYWCFLCVQIVSQSSYVLNASSQFQNSVWLLRTNQQSVCSKNIQVEIFQPWLGGKVGWSIIQFPKMLWVWSQLGCIWKAIN